MTKELWTKQRLKDTLWRAIYKDYKDNPYPSDIFSWDRKETNLILHGYFLAIRAIALELNCHSEAGNCDDQIRILTNIRTEKRRKDEISKP